MSDPYRPDSPERATPPESYTRPLPAPGTIPLAESVVPPPAATPFAPATIPLAPPPMPGNPPGFAPPLAQAGQAYYVPATIATERPAGVTIIALWQWFCAGLIGLGSLAILLLGSVLLNATNDPGGLSQMFTIFGGFMIGVFGFLALIVGLLIFAGRGLWRLRNGGRILTIVLQSINALINGLALSGGEAGGGTIASLVISGAIIGYLCLPKVRMRFQ